MWGFLMSILLLLVMCIELFGSGGLIVLILMRLGVFMVVGVVVLVRLYFLSIVMSALWKK